MCSALNPWEAVISTGRTDKKTAIRENILKASWLGPLMVMMPSLVPWLRVGDPHPSSPVPAPSSSRDRSINSHCLILSVTWNEIRGTSVTTTEGDITL